MVKAESTSSDDVTLKFAGVNVSVSPFKSNVYPEKMLLIEFDVRFIVIPSTISSASEAACFCALLGVPEIVGSALKSNKSASAVVI